MATVEQDTARSQQQLAAQDRVEARASHRAQLAEILKRPDGVRMADTPERIAKRVDRLSRYYAGEELPATPQDVPRAAPGAIIDAARERLVESGTIEVAEAAAEGEAPGGEIALERIINTDDFVDVRYLEAGARAARAVARVRIADASGRIVGYGTGSLVSPRLLLTNNHVLPTLESAAASSAEFDFQDGVDGQPLRSTVLRLDPSAFWLADRDLDFALVAVRAAPSLAGYGCNRLIEAEGKAIVGEFVTIVQHPRGERKQVALRDNRIVDVLERHLHYAADTEPGSSGSPVFNDQWEIVALHHASVRAPAHDELGGYVNEGVRVSRLVRFIRSHELGAPMRPLRDALFGREVIDVRPLVSFTPGGAPAGDDGAAATVSVDAAAGTAVPPIEISIRIGGGAAAAAADDAAADERLEIDPDYASRPGFDEAFLGDGAHRVPLPAVAAALTPLLAVAMTGGSGPDPILRYHHSSIVMHRVRRLALFTAVNIDGTRTYDLERSSDRWVLDPRIDPSEQTDNDVYAGNDLDRGHLVRRRDPVWGDSESEAKFANDDTFHYTNCSPQHARFNRNEHTWNGVENYILYNAENHGLKVCVFTGPVLADDDDVYRGVMLPRQYWKVVTMLRRSDDSLSTTAYLLSQASLLAGLEADEEFQYGAYRTYQVRVSRIAELTGLDFGPLVDADPLAGAEATTFARELETPEGIQL